MTHARRLVWLICAVIAGALSACATSTPRLEPETDRASDALFDTVAALDAAVFDSFNNCSSPEELGKHASYFAADVEFYHDTGGVTWTRQDMLANTLALGVHRFCQIESADCEGMADFAMLWRNQGGSWQITRVLSYGHRPSN